VQRRSVSGGDGFQKIGRAQACSRLANLTEAAQQRNIELGVLIRRPSIVTAIRHHFDQLIASRFLWRLPL
jgi:hypothetical protein